MRRVYRICKASACAGKTQKGKEEEKSSEKEAKRDQKLFSGVEAQTRVIELGAEYWIKVNEFVTIKKISFSPDQMRAIKYAMRIPTQLPNAYQSTLLLSLLEEAKANGFKS